MGHGGKDADSGRAKAHLDVLNGVGEAGLLELGVHGGHGDDALAVGGAVVAGVLVAVSGRHDHDGAFAVGVGHGVVIGLGALSPGGPAQGHGNDVGAVVGGRYHAFDDAGLAAGAVVAEDFDAGNLEEGSADVEGGHAEGVAVDGGHDAGAVRAVRMAVAVVAAIDGLVAGGQVLVQGVHAGVEDEDAGDLAGPEGTGLEGLHELVEAELAQGPLLADAGVVEAEVDGRLLGRGVLWRQREADDLVGLGPVHQGRLVEALEDENGLAELLAGNVEQEVVVELGEFGACQSGEGRAQSGVEVGHGLLEGLGLGGILEVHQELAILGQLAETVLELVAAVVEVEEDEKQENGQRRGEEEGGLVRGLVDQDAQEEQHANVLDPHEDLEEQVATAQQQRGEIDEGHEHEAPAGHLAIFAAGLGADEPDQEKYPEGERHGVQQGLHGLVYWLVRLWESDFHGRHELGGGSPHLNGENQGGLLEGGLEAQAVLLELLGQEHGTPFFAIVGDQAPESGLEVDPAHGGVGGDDLAVHVVG